jgi:hypothetical protein
LPWLEYPYPLKNLVTVVPVLDVPARYDDTRKDEILYWQREYLRGRIYTMIEFVMKFSHRILVHVSEDKALTSWDMLVGDAIQLEDYICVDCELSRPEAFRARFMETLQSLHC